MSTSSPNALKNDECFSLEIQHLPGELHFNVIYQKCKLHFTPGGADYSNYYYLLFFFSTINAGDSGENVQVRGGLLFSYFLNNFDLYGSYFSNEKQNVKLQPAVKEVYTLNEHCRDILINIH